MADILVLGATGFTGRLITRYLYNHPQRASFTFALGVRNTTKGKELLKSLDIDDSVKLVPIDLTTYEAIEAVVKETKVVINTVGPYWIWGADVVRACAVHGKRYVDLAGELHFIKKIVSKYDQLATRTGAVIVNTCGFDSIPADILVYLSNKTLKDALGPQAQLGLSQTFYSVRGGFSGGTLNTMMSDIEKTPREIFLEANKDYSISQVPGHPSPPRQLAAPVPLSSPAQYGTFWPMAGINRGVVQRTFGLNELTSTYAHVLLDAEHKDRAAQIKQLAYGPQFRYEEYLLLGSGRSRVLATLFSTFVQTWLALVFFVAPVRWLFKLVAPKPGEGPSEKDMKKGWMDVTNYTEAASESGVYAKSTMKGNGDPGYLLTSMMMVESALALLLDDASLPPHARIGGVLTPATALGDVLIKRLEATGRMHFSSELVRRGDESRKDR